MSVIDRRRVEAAFSRASDYDSNAGVQRIIADGLAQRIAALPLHDDARVLEVGCGTGFLTRALIEAGVPGHWLVTDRAPAMVERCREALNELGGGAPSRRFAVLDGEHGLAALDCGYDLVCASMALQWFDDLASALPRLMRLLAPGGHLVFNTLAAHTFVEWRAAHRECGLSDGVVAFPLAAHLASLFDDLGAQEVTVENYIERHDDARTFLARLKAIGASTARTGHRPLPPRDLRRVMAAFEAHGAAATYEVVTCRITRGEQ